MATILDYILRDTDSCKTLGIEDTSTYDQGFGISKPTLLITLPGFNNQITYNFYPKKLNIINSNNLGLTNTSDPNALVELPDGIYKVVYTVNPSTTYSVEKSFLRTCKLNGRYEHALLSLDILNCSDKDQKVKVNKLKEIEFLIYSAIAAANTGNSGLAVQLYRAASKELDRFEKIY